MTLGEDLPLHFWVVFIWKKNKISFWVKGISSFFLITLKSLFPLGPDPEQVLTLVLVEPKSTEMQHE